MRIARRVLFGSVICLFCVVNASAQGLAGKIGVAPMIGASMPIQYLRSDEGGGMATIGFAAGVSGEYFIDEDVSVGGRFVFDRFGMDIPDADRSGSWTMLEVGVFGRYQFMPGSATRPFARAGVLMGKAKVKIKNGSEEEGDIAMAPGAELAGGIIHQVKENVSVFGEVGWTAIATDGKEVKVTEDGNDVGTFESEKHLQWIGIKAGVIILLGGNPQ